MPKVLSYEDKMYKNQDSGKHIYDCIYQAFLDLKAEKRHSGWNLPVNEQGGLTIKFIGENKLLLTYFRVEVGTIEEIAKNKQTTGKDYLKMFVSELKKKFKAETSNSLKLEVVKHDQDVEHYQRTYADTAWFNPSNRPAQGRSNISKFFVKDMCVYSFDTE